ncbi:MAG: hypothetical protein P1P84_01400 [Deferrisomatales bacterium]|nr:hypothetical protein [Deferrisomatales bacterium]
MEGKPGNLDNFHVPEIVLMQENYPALLASIVARWEATPLAGWEAAAHAQMVAAWEVFKAEMEAGRLAFREGVPSRGALAAAAIVCADGLLCSHRGDHVANPVPAAAFNAAILERLGAELDLRAVKASNARKNTHPTKEAAERDTRLHPILDEAEARGLSYDDARLMVGKRARTLAKFKKSTPGAVDKSVRRAMQTHPFYGLDTR